MRRSALLVILLALAVGCAQSLSRHAAGVSPPPSHADVSRALAELERLEREGWLERVTSGSCARTHAERPGDEVIMSFADDVETTPAACRDVLDRLAALGELRARLERDEEVVGALEAFRRAVRELRPVGAECAEEHGALTAIVAAIARHDHELDVAEPGAIAADGVARCQVATLGGPLAVGSRRALASGELRAGVSSMVVLRGDVLPERPRAEPSHPAQPGEYVFSDDWGVPTEGAWRAAPVVRVEVLRGSGSFVGSATTYTLVRAADEWRVIDALTAEH